MDEYYYAYPFRPSSFYGGSRLLVDNSCQSTYDHAIIEYVEEIVARYVIDI
jgi:hypothetical protein